jgi:hypothetical protein
LEAVHGSGVTACAALNLQPCTEADKIGSRADMLRGHAAELDPRERFENKLDFGH